MSVLALGLSHHSAPLDLRGRFAVPLERLAPTLQALRAHLAARGAAATGLALLSTCNRTELYFGAADAPALLPPVQAWLAAQGGATPARLGEHCYVREGDDAARHAFRVASGLDSAVLGEPQILGQLKSAVRAADGAGVLGPTLHQLFQRSFAVAKAVRSRTELGSHAVGVAAASVAIAQRLFGELRAQHVLCVGAGEMVELVATHFAARGPASVTVANRSPARAEALAARLHGQARPLAGLDRALPEFDIVVSGTASTLPLIGLGAMQRALKARRRRPMLLLDLAVPRDVEAEVGELPDAYLYTVDDLAREAAAGGARRQAAVAPAEALVEQGVQAFRGWLAQREALPLVHALQAQAAQWQAAELRRARRALAAGAPAEAVAERLAAALVRKALHGALAGLRASQGEAHAAWAGAARRCFLEGRR